MENPSTSFYVLKPGDVVSVRNKSKKLDIILESMRHVFKGDMDLTWLGLDKGKIEEDLSICS